MATITGNSLRWVVALFVILSCIGCDQTTKRLATNTLRHAAPQSYCADTIRLEYALNPGGFLSLGSQLPDSIRPWIFVGLNLCLMAGVVAFLLLQRDTPLVLFVALVSVLAGGVGNLIDRISNNGF